jgi:hypothetical protein
MLGRALGQSPGPGGPHERRGGDGRTPRSARQQPAVVGYRDAFDGGRADVPPKRGTGETPRQWRSRACLAVAEARDVALKARAQLTLEEHVP